MPTLIPSIGYLIVIIKSGLAWYCHHRESCRQSENKNKTQKSSVSWPDSEEPIQQAHAAIGSGMSLISSLFAQKAI